MLENKKLLPVYFCLAALAGALLGIALTRFIPLKIPVRRNDLSLYIFAAGLLFNVFMQISRLRRAVKDSKRFGAPVFWVITRHRRQRILYLLIEAFVAAAFIGFLAFYEPPFLWTVAFSLMVAVGLYVSVSLLYIAGGVNHNGVYYYDAFYPWDMVTESSLTDKKHHTVLNLSYMVQPNWPYNFREIHLPVNPEEKAEILAYVRERIKPGTANECESNSST